MIPVRLELFEVASAHDIHWYIGNRAFKIFSSNSIPSTVAPKFSANFIVSLNLSIISFKSLVGFL